MLATTSQIRRAYPDLQGIQNPRYRYFLLTHAVKIVNHPYALRLIIGIPHQRERLNERVHQVSPDDIQELVQRARDGGYMSEHVESLERCQDALLFADTAGAEDAVPLTT